MAYIKDVQVGSDVYLIEPALYIAPSKNGAAYTATLTNFSLVTGATVQAKFAATNDANATLNVNSTGAKEIHYNGAKITASQFKANHAYTLVYDGTQWQVVGDIDTNTTYSLSGLGGIGTISASGTAPLTLSGSKSGTTYTLTGSVADASASASGVVNTDAQTFSGVKTFDNGLHIYGTISTQGTGSVAGTMYPGGAYHSGHNSIILHGDTAGISGIGFTSEKATKSDTTTNINGSSDRAFIQYHAYGVTPAAEGTAPTLATSGELGTLVIGVGNDANDTIRLQAPGTAGILHQIGATAYPIPHTTNTNGSVGGTTTPVYVEAGVIKALSYTIAKSVPANAVFTDHYAWADITSKPETATRWPTWSEVTGKPSTFAPSVHEHNYLVPVSASVSSGQASPNNTLALGIKKYFDDNKTTIPRDKLISFNVSAYSNAVYAFGHFISGYNDTPYGGFYAVHYQTPRFLGIAAGSYEESLLARVNVTNTITSGQIMIADGTNGKIKTSGYTIAKSVPSDAVFTDTNKYHKTGSWSGLTYTATAVNSADELKFTIPNKIQTNWELNATSGNSPALLFTRDSTLTDWKIFVSSGRLIFQSATDGSTWTERAYFKDNSGDFVATSFTGDGSALTDLNASNLASGTVPVTRLPLATASAAGAVKIGSGISVSDGTISVTAANLGLSNALHFIGITSTTLTDGSTTATLTAKSTNSLSKTTGFVDGDVVMDGDQLREYVWSGSTWRLLGITTSTAYTQPASTATNTWIAQVSQGTDGKITATTGSLNTSGTWSGKANTAGTADKISNLVTADQASSSDTWRRVWISYADNVTGRPAWTDNLVFQTSTNTLKTTKFQGALIGNADSATTSTWTTLLKPIASTTTASASTWNIPSGSKQVWGERFSDSTLKYTPSGGSETTVTDTGDWTMWLTSGGTSNAATLNMRIDGTYYGSFSGNLSGNASTATKSGVAAIWLYSENSNEINFGGTHTGTILYFGYRAKDSRAIPTKFVFGSSTGTADLQAKTVYLGSGTSSYISSTQYTGNAATATTAANLANNPSIQASTSNTNQVTITAGGKTSSAYTIPYATSAGSATSATTATYIKCTDTRSTALNPTDLNAAQGIRFDFKAKGTINLTATDAYAGVMSFRPYASNSDWSGGNAHQIAFNSEGLHWRNGGASWGNWYQILDSNNTSAAKANGTAVSVTCGTDATLATINGVTVKINVTKPTYTYSDVGAAAANHGTHVTAATVKSALNTGSDTTKFLNNKGDWAVPAYTTSLAWSAITSKPNLSIGNARIFYGTSSTAAGTAAKVVTCSIYDAYTAGDILVVKFDNANTAGSPTLNVNSKGAKNIRKIYNGAVNTLNANGEITGTCMFVYDGAQWLLTNADYNNTYTIPTSFSITANATDGLWNISGSGGNNQVTYAVEAYSSKQTGASFYTGTANPDGTTRLNYNGYLYATKLYSNGTEVSVSGHTHSYLSAISWSGDTNLKLKQSINGAAATDVLQFVAGSNITLTGASGKITIAGTANDAVTHTLSTITKYYVTGTTSATTSTGGDTFDTGIYATTTAGQLNATSYKVNEKVTLQWNSTDNSLDFVFA